jgi:NCS2 family nucleobase:cation symporter-2
MYAGAVAALISADLFCCGIVTLIQSLGVTQWFGIRLPVMMSVTFASVTPMVAMAGNTPGVAGAQLIFGAIIGAGIVSIALAPVVSRMCVLSAGGHRHHHRVIGISLMRIGINWIFGNPFGPTAPSMSADHARWLAEVGSMANAAPAAGSSAPLASGAGAAQGPEPVGSVPSKYAPLAGIGVRGGAAGDSDRRLPKLRGQHPVLLGIIVGGVVASLLGMMNFDQAGQLVDRAAPAVRHAGVRPGADPDHDPGDDRRHDRVHRHVPCAG